MRRRFATLRLKGLPDIVLMDYLMSGPTPEEFVARLRARGYEGPILLCTAMDSLPELPIDGVVHKPFDPDELVTAVAAHLDGRAAREP